MIELLEKSYLSRSMRELVVWEYERRQKKAARDNSNLQGGVDSA